MNAQKHPFMWHRYNIQPCSQAPPSTHVQLVSGAQILPPRSLKQKGDIQGLEKSTGNKSGYWYAYHCVLVPSIRMANYNIQNYHTMPYTWTSHVQTLSCVKSVTVTDCVCALRACTLYATLKLPVHLEHEVQALQTLDMPLRYHTHIIQYNAMRHSERNLLMCRKSQLVHLHLLQ